MIGTLFHFWGNIYYKYFSGNLCLRRKMIFGKTVIIEYKTLLILTYQKSISTIFSFYKNFNTRKMLKKLKIAIKDISIWFTYITGQNIVG